MRRSGPLTAAVLAALSTLGATTAPTAAPTTTPTSAPAMAAMPTTAPVGAATLPPAGPVVPAGPGFPARLYDAVAPSLVAVQFTYTGEVQQADVILPGMVVGDGGLILFPALPFFEQLPDSQLRRFKVIVPHLATDNEELDATYLGRDERTDMGLVQVKVAAGHKWVPIRFAERLPDIGDTVYSMGVLPRSGGYHAVLNPSVVSSHLRGPVKQVMVAGGSLAPYGGPVFDSTGTAIGMVGFQFPAPFTLDDRNPQQEAAESVVNNRYFLPTSEFALTLTDGPTAGHPVPMAFTGVPELTGLKKDEADYLGLAGQPVVQVGDVMPDSPAAKAGLKTRDVIVTLNGHPLERGDTPEELPLVLRHTLSQLPPGTTVTFGVLRGGPGKPLTDVRITMAPRPMTAREAKRYWSEEIGFGVREPVLLDRYSRKMKPADPDGVVVYNMKPEGSARTAGLQMEDLILQVNGTPTPSLAQFESTYKGFRTAHAHDAIVMVVKREGREQTIRIEPPQ